MSLLCQCCGWQPAQPSGRQDTCVDACSADGIQVRCTLQEEALKPFVAVLRLADSPAVRQRAVQAVAAALTAHPRGLGSGMSAPSSCCCHLATQRVDLQLIYLHAQPESTAK